MCCAEGRALADRISVASEATAAALGRQGAASAVPPPFRSAVDVGFHRLFGDGVAGAAKGQILEQCYIRLPLF